MKKFKLMICILLAVGVSVGSTVAADAQQTRTIVRGYTTPPESENSISLGTAQVDDSNEYIILAEIPITLTVQVAAEDVSDETAAAYAASDTVDVELYATITLAQKRGTTKLTTTVVVRPESLLDTPLISSVSVSERFSNKTEFELPDCTDSFTIVASPASNYVEGSNTTPYSFISGHTIMAIITITDIQLENGTWSGGSFSVSREVTIS